MIRLFHAYFPTRTLLLVVSEAFLIFLALFAATYARFGGEMELALTYEQGFLKIAIASAVCLLCMYYYDLYDSVVLSSPREVLTRLIQVLGTACLLLSLLYFSYPDIRLGRGIFLLGIVLVGLSLAGWRKLFFALNQSSLLAQRVVVLGEGPLAASLVAEIEKRPELGLNLLGYVGPGRTAEGLNGLRRLGAVEELPELIDRERIGRVIVSMSDRRGKLPVDSLLQVKSQGVLIQDAASVYEAVAGRVSLDTSNLSWLLFSPGFRISRAVRIYKRASSILLAVLGLLLSLPLMVLLALAILLDSPGPVVFRQQRRGKNGKLFTLYKFRSMRHEAENEGTARPAEVNDERITRVGRWLRRSHLDELPQLYNILRGDMYFVGPRPLPANVEEEELARQSPFYRYRLAVNPGVTGWAQINRGYCASLEENIEKLSYDLFYIKNVSVGLDLLILFQTVKILLLGRGGR